MTPNARVAVITGASSGLGLVTAKALAAQGFRIIGTGRDPGRMAAAEAQIREAAAPWTSVEMIRADLSLVAGAARLADEVAAKTDRIDLLINNAGGAPSVQEMTSEGYEATFTGNHLGHFLLTDRLLPQLRKAAADQPAGATRIINVSSSAHEFTEGFDWNNLQMIEGFIPIRAYCNAKLANVLFTRKLAERLAGSGIVVHAMHPGAVDTNFVDRADEGTRTHLRSMQLLTPEQGADTLIWLTTAKEAGEKSGRYWQERTDTEPSKLAQDPDSEDRLWRESEKLVSAVLEPAGR